LRPALAWTILFFAVLVFRLTQTRILWVEESYPAAAAIQMLHGSVPYRDFVFDKPPLSAAIYLLWGAHDGWPLRLAGALYVLLCARLAYGLASQLWNRATGWIAAGLLAFFLTFYHASAVMALSPDMLMVAPHLAAVWAAAVGRPLLAGVLSGIALHVHTKALFVAAVCLLWGSPMRLLAGFVITAIPPFLLQHGYWSQVWYWGMRYSRDTFVENPLQEAIVRTANWLGFHASLAIAAGVFWYRDRTANVRRLAIWTVLSLVAIGLGWRFFPRYYLQLLPALTVIAARGIGLAGTRTTILIGALLIIPLIRFLPHLVRDPSTWTDLAMARDADRAADAVSGLAHTGDTILVWGYRPEILVRTRMPLGAPFLDSQPLTGVLADRHLRLSEPTFPKVAALNRAKLREYRPTFVIDGLGPYNPALAIDRFGDLEGWLGQYQVVARTAGCVMYRLR
jgi:hypothetical protein